MAKKAKVAYCPSCDNPVHLSGTVRIGRKFECKACNAELEVVELNPIVLDWVFDYEDTADDPYTDYDY